MLDFLVIGDIMVDRILRLADPEIINTIDTKVHTVTLPYPSKNRLTTPPEVHGGGNAYNVASAMRKLGLETALYTIVGKDSDGQRMLGAVKELGVNCDLVQVDEEHETNSAVILSINSDRVVFSYHYERNYQLPQIPPTKYVYLTSVGENDLPLFQQVIAQKEQLGFQLIFSPGTLQVSEAFTDVHEIMQHTDVLILNKPEAAKISRLNTESNEYLLQGLHKLGPKTVIITRSERGSVAFDGNNTYKVGALPVQPVECTGAGDCYAATVSAALAIGNDIPTAMAWGAINSASVITSIGATNGQLERPALEQMHAEKKDQLKYEEATSSEVGIPKPTESFAPNS